jgi:hypothetical protein
MPKFQVSVARGVAKRDVVEVAADSPEEACWIALSCSGSWKDVDMDAVSVSMVSEPADHKVVTLRTAA